MIQLFGRLWQCLKRIFNRKNPDSGLRAKLDAEIGAETPIRSSSEDRLRRVEFASRIADVLSALSLSEGRIFAIRGEWGFGKSSLKNLIAERFGKMSNGADWIDFNPWRWGEGDALVRTLFGQIADRLGSEHSKEAQSRADDLRKYARMLAKASAPLKKASESISVISMVLTNASVIVVASAVGFDLPTVAFVAGAFAILSFCIPIFVKILESLGRDRSNESLDEIRNSLERRLREMDRPLVVFVDDIDRLEPGQIRTLLRHVKSNANLPNIVFVLIFQSSIVEKALDPVAGNNGRAFLEKIVQVNFDLPAVPVSVVHRIFGEELSKIAGPYATEENGFSQTRWGNVFVGCIQPYLRNMRDARRLLSSIAIHIPLHVDGGVYEVNIVDFLLLETIRVFEPDLHQILFQEKELVLQEQRYSGDGRKDSDKLAVQKLLEVVSQSRKKTAEISLKNLFPAIEWVFQGMSYEESSNGRWLSEKRVCTARYFPRYFELQATDGELSERRFVDFMHATVTDEQLSIAMAEVEKDDLLQSLAVRLDESVDRLPVENSDVLLPGMFRIAEKLSERRGVDPFNSPWTSAWRATSWFLHRVPEEKRGGMALEAFRKTEALSVAAILVHLSESAEAKKESSTIPVLDTDTVKSMKEEWLRVVRRRSLTPDTLLNHPHFVSHLYDWKNYSGSFDEPRAWIAKVAQPDQGFVKVVSQMMNRGMRHTSGDRVSTPYNTFSKEMIEDFFGIDVVNRRCADINSSDFPGYEESLRTLENHIHSWITNKRVSSTDALEG
ncbi:KAP family P-loop NTPase fold protein [Delftia acidovorans]|uniref:P-loop NTPase fold protein n=1 Tax=Delftia acidovorans TaxID=80866 RepID=A0AAJ2VCJ9_DELAC|nr:P-loop NTPase fold protein [Delftia acidovorans]MDX4953847.1 P-loop NTPase fold protein [Delftia acidovorans]